MQTVRKRMSKALTLTEESRVTKSNRLIEARYKLTVREQRFVLLMASQIHPDDDRFTFYEIETKKLISLMGLEKDKRAYERLKEMITRLQTRIMKIQEPKQEVRVSWIASSVYRDDGTIEFEFSERLKPYLLQLKKEFTSYRLKDVIQLKSSYSIRLYELLKQFQRTRKRRVKLDELKLYLGIDPGKYKLYGHFKKKVLLVAQDELEKRSDIRFEFEEVKEGRKVVAFEFRIIPNDKELSLLPSAEGKPNLLPIMKDLLALDLQFNEKVALRIAEQEWGFLEWEKVQDRERLVSMRDEGYSFAQYIREKIQLAKMSNGGAGFLLNAIKHNWTTAEQKQEHQQKAARDKQEEKSAKEQAAREAEEQSRIESQKKSAEYDRRFSGLPMLAQEEIRRRATEMYKQNATDFERVRYEKEKINGKTIDEMSVMVAVTYRKYRNQLMDSPEFAELDSEVIA